MFEVRAARSWGVLRGRTNYSVCMIGAFPVPTVYSLHIMISIMHEYKYLWRFTK